ncbi:hypothetical protein A0H76_1947 [Hepatospora eriocheir]|uniref:Uncharacterized protein n=1 Tax=Hepatospora eriocheir TaxID=1081669 RepID=A0A1X0QGG7_9MICR|nr:hypothetical protein A0H76_1947 [Hepatospora eriocheir]
MLCNIQVSKELIEKLSLIDKFSSKVTLTPKTLESSFIIVNLPKFCNFTICVNTKDLLEMIRSTDHFELNNEIVIYKCLEKYVDSSVEITKTFKTYEVIKSGFSEEEISVIHVEDIVTTLTTDDVIISYKEGVFSFKSHGLIQTRIEFKASLMSGKKIFKCKASGKSLEIFKEFQGDLVVSLSKNFLLLKVFENEILIECLIPLINY